MVKVNFGKKNEPGFELMESEDLIAVRTRSQQSLSGFGPVASAMAAEVSDGQLVLSFPDAGVEVFRVPTRERSIEARKLSLRSAADVRFAGSVLVLPDSKHPALYTENIYVRFTESTDTDRCRETIRAAGLTIKRELPFAPNAFFVTAPEGTGQRVFEIAQALLERTDVVYSHPELIFRRQSKSIFPQQWHLASTTINGISINAHANVAAAHATTEGAGVVIAVIDDGIDIDHPEFASPGKVVSPRDATLKNDNPRPRFASDRHGTPCAGVACASGVQDASGVAPKAHLLPIRLASGLGSIEEAEAFRWAADNGADVISCSWGPADGDWWNPNDPLHHQRFDLPASSRDAIDYAVTRGRGGKGCVVLFAAGNGNESVDLDGYASYHHVIAVAACNDTSRRSVYSDFGNAVLCSFPSNDLTGGPNPNPTPLTTGIWSTDIRGSQGYNPGNASLGDVSGNYTNSFGGTSSSCPGAAGIAALVLSQNPDLRYFEVRDVLARSCDKIDPTGGNYDLSTGRSPKYGYGRLNAATAVQLATQGRGLLLVVRKAINEAIPDLGVVEAEIDVANSALVEDFWVHVRLRHTYIGDLVITLIPPPTLNAPNIVLHKRAGGNQRDLDRDFDTTSVPKLAEFRNTTCSGVWKFRVEDKAREDFGMLDQISVFLSLPPQSTDGGDGAAVTDLSSLDATNQVSIGSASRSNTSRRIASRKKSRRGQ